MKSTAFSGLLAALLLSFAVACGGAATGSIGAGQTLDLTDTADKLTALQSFRFDFQMQMDFPDIPATGSEEDAFGAAFASAFLSILSDIKAEGAFVSPDKVDAKMSFGGEEVSFIQIGNRSWTKSGSTWKEEPVTGPLGLDLGLGSPTDFLTEFLPGEVLRGAKTSKERMNGVDTTRYSFDKAALEKLVAESGEDVADFQKVSKAKLDVWLSAENIPMKVLMDIAGEDKDGQDMGMRLEMNIRDLNGNITIKPPI
jgi:hypothetical protein